MMKNNYNSTKRTDLDKKLENGNGTIGDFWTDTDHGLRASLLPKGGNLADKLSTSKSSGGDIEGSELSRERTIEATPGPATVGQKTEPIKY